MDTKSSDPEGAPRLVALSVMAAELGVRPDDLRREALAKRVPCVRIGERSLLFDRDLVARLLLERAGTDVAVNRNAERRNRGDQ